MEMEYRDPSKRGKFIVVIGIVLALAAGGAAFFLINQAQQQAGQGSLQKIAVVVAARPIPARKPVEVGDVAMKEIPLDTTNSAAIAITQIDQVVGRVLAVPVLQDQMLTQNLLGSTATGGLSILEPGETVAPESEAWRAVSLTVPDDRAVGGMLQPGMTVDVLMSVTVNVPQDLLESGKYYTDKSTKIAYQNVVILARQGQFYIVKATLAVAEEMAHLQAAGNATFSFVMRPEADIRQVDATTLGETTNRLISKYGLPVPEVYPPGNGPLPTPLPTPTATPAPASQAPEASASTAP
ncbi:MAG TPA: Flp pilus assembly protein CpaB [Candidatus Limnocylindrales bacterium]|jgi:Flp pilus assembly protein CpaB|nr:Flp pilus assembly protein CpaB [Candidatus Limnocylindrales bacterium]